MRHDQGSVRGGRFCERKWIWVHPVLFLHVSFLFFFLSMRTNLRFRTITIFKVVALRGVHFSSACVELNAQEEGEIEKIDLVTLGDEHWAEICPIQSMSVAVLRIQLQPQLSWWFLTKRMAEWGGPLEGWKFTFTWFSWGPPAFEAHLCSNGLMLHANTECALMLHPF